MFLKWDIKGWKNIHYNFSKLILDTSISVRVYSVPVLCFCVYLVAIVGYNPCLNFVTAQCNIICLKSLRLHYFFNFNKKKQNCANAVWPIRMARLLKIHCASKAPCPIVNLEHLWCNLSQVKYQIYEIQSYQYQEGILASLFLFMRYWARFKSCDHTRSCYLYFHHTSKAEA